LLCPGFFAIFAPAVAKVYIVSFRTHDDRRPSKFIVLADAIVRALSRMCSELDVNLNLKAQLEVGELLRTNRAG
jgi:hypothetical protein